MCGVHIILCFNTIISLFSPNINASETKILKDFAQQKNFQSRPLISLICKAIVIWECNFFFTHPIDELKSDLNETCLKIIHFLEKLTNIE